MISSRRMRVAHFVSPLLATLQLDLSSTLAKLAEAEAQLLHNHGLLLPKVNLKWAARFDLTSSGGLSTLASP